MNSPLHGCLVCVGANLFAQFSTAKKMSTNTILLVEDDSSLRLMLRGVLEMQGFSVLEADCRHRGIETQEAHPHVGVVIPPDLCFSRNYSGKQAEGKTEGPGKRNEVETPKAHAQRLQSSSFEDLHTRLSALAKRHSDYPPEQLPFLKNTGKAVSKHSIVFFLHSWG